MYWKTYPLPPGGILANVIQGGKYEKWKKRGKMKEQWEEPKDQGEIEF